MSATIDPPAESHLGRLAEQAFDRLGDYEVISFEGRWYSFGGLLDRILRISAGLTKLGLEAGDRAVVSMPNSPDVPVLYNAIWRAGGVVTPAMSILSEEELRHVIGDSGARMVVVSAELVEKVSRAVDGLDDVERIICVDSDQQQGTVPLAELEGDARQALVERRPTDIAALLYTGGTTGRAKGVMLSHRNIDVASRILTEYERDFEVSRELMVLPLAHSFGLLATLGILQRTEPKVWAMERRFDPPRALALIQEHALDELQAVPSMIQMMLAEPLEDFDLSSFRVVYSGGSPLAPEAYHEFRRRVPSASIYEGYGLTENATLLSCTPLGGERIGSVGTALPGVDVRIVDNDGAVVPDGEPGEILTRSAAVMLGYWRDQANTAQALVDGWLATGDIGRLDEDGYIYILDRKKELIIRGGFNVFPRDVEDRLLEHPAIRMAGVVGRPDADRGEEIVAFVVLKSGGTTTAAEIVEWSREHIGGYKYPREVHLRDSLPLTGVGKVDRKALRRTLAPRET